MIFQQLVDLIKSLIRDPKGFLAGCGAIAFLLLLLSIMLRQDPRPLILGPYVIEEHSDTVWCDSGKVAPPETVKIGFVDNLIGSVKPAQPETVTAYKNAMSLPQISWILSVVKQKDRLWVNTWKLMDKDILSITYGFACTEDFELWSDSTWVTAGGLGGGPPLLRNHKLPFNLHLLKYEGVNFEVEYAGGFGIKSPLEARFWTGWTLDEKFGLRTGVRVPIWGLFISANWRVF